MRATKVNTPISDGMIFTAAGDEVAQDVGADMDVRVRCALRGNLVAKFARLSGEAAGQKFFFSRGGSAKFLVDVGAGADEGHMGQVLKNYA